MERDINKNDDYFDFSEDNPIQDELLMESEDHKDEANEIDPFSQFMFGKTIYRERNEKESSSFNNNEWLFGRRSPANDDDQRDRGGIDLFSLHPRQSQKSEQKNSIGNILQNVNYIELMEHMDTLMNSAKELKPLLSKVRPLIDQFTNKK
ncbi:hypothetical protein ACFYKX_07060 [Cytobacillus sp. FJAT-54145]|uniref:Uncharacterized protein n=1 Tax=Cytobacillus spartinae TaxID=3299023 RepID=A0ABW6KBS5_9BACI